MIAEPTLCTCPVCGHPAQHEATPGGEGYITCGHCAAITFDRTADDEPAAEFYAQAQAPDAMRLVPEHSPHYARERAAARPYIHVNSDVNGGEYAPAREAANAIIAARKAAAQPVCPCNSPSCPCCDPSHPEAPERGWEREEEEARVNWSEGPKAATPAPPLSPVEALRLAVTHCVGAVPTMLKLRAALEAADEEAITRAEQLAAARDQVAVNLEMHRVEAVVFGLPF